MNKLIFALVLLGTVPSFADPQPGAPTAKPIVVEVHHASALAEATLRGMKAVPKIVTAAEFVGNSLSAYRALSYTGKGVRFGGTIVGKLSPAAPFITAWFVANAPLDSLQHQLNKEVAGAALNEAISKADQLLALNEGAIEIKYDGKIYNPAEVIAYFKSLQQDLQTADPTWGDGVLEALKAAVPVPFLFENDTANRQFQSASAQALLAQAIRDLTAAVTPEIVERARANSAQQALFYWQKLGEETRVRFFDGLKCNIYVVCRDPNLSWEKHSAEQHTVKASIEMTSPDPKKDPTGKFRYAIMSHILTDSANLTRNNWGCVRNELFGVKNKAEEVAAANQKRVFYAGTDPNYLYQDGTAPAAADVQREIRRACMAVKGWAGDYFVQYSGYQITGVELFRSTYVSKNDGRGTTDSFFFANPEVPELMSKMAGDIHNYRQFVPQYEPPQMRAR